MRGAQVLAAIVFLGSLGGGAAYAQSRAAKEPPPDVGPRRVAWFDITTSDIAAAMTFYGGLFDWRFNPLQGTDAAVERSPRSMASSTSRSPTFRAVSRKQRRSAPPSCLDFLSICLMELEQSH
jgi:hypothetical protein